MNCSFVKYGSLNTSQSPCTTWHFRHAIFVVLALTCTVPLASLSYWTASCPRWRPPITECFCSVRWPPSWPSWRIILATVTSSICVWMVSNQCKPNSFYVFLPFRTSVLGISNWWPTTFLMSVITHTVNAALSISLTRLFLVVSSRNYEVWRPGRAFKEIQQWRLPVFYLPVEHQGRWFGPQLASCRHRCDLWQWLEPPPGLCDLEELDIHVPSFQLSSDLSSLNPTWEISYSISDSA